jgi:hypothetical protein
MVGCPEGRLTLPMSRQNTPHLCPRRPPWPRSAWRRNWRARPVLPSGAAEQTLERFGERYFTEVDDAANVAEVATDPIPPINDVLRRSPAPRPSPSACSLIRSRSRP